MGKKKLINWSVVLIVLLIVADITFTYFAIGNPYWTNEYGNTNVSVEFSSVIIKELEQAKNNSLPNEYIRCLDIKEIEKDKYEVVKVIETKVHNATPEDINHDECLTKASIHSHLVRGYDFPSKTDVMTLLESRKTRIVCVHYEKEKINCFSLKIVKLRIV